MPFSAHTGPSVWNSFPLAKCLFTPTSQAQSSTFFLRSRWTAGHRILPGSVSTAVRGLSGVNARGRQEHAPTLLGCFKVYMC